MTEDEFKFIIKQGYEKQGIEFKGPANISDRHHFAKVIRAMLGMSNKRDGGLVIVGVDEDVHHKLIPSGISPTDLPSWNYDDIASKANAYADPPIEFDIETVKATYAQELSFVVISVKEFPEIPTLCKKDFSTKEVLVLRKGACYVRSKVKPETSEIPSQSDMRGLLDIAIDKGVRKFARQKYLYDQTYGPSPQSSTPSDEILFRNQIEGEN